MREFALSQNLFDVHLAKGTVSMLSEPNFNALRVKAMVAEKFNLFLVLNHFLEANRTVRVLSVVDHMRKLLEFCRIYGVIIEILRMGASVASEEVVVVAFLAEPFGGRSWRYRD